MRKLFVALLAAGAVIGLLMLSGAEAAKQQLTCGATITTDTTLDTDLVDCPNNGIVIGADDITLDLNGHTIDGDGTELADCPKKAFCDVGVLNDGHDGVAVMHGSVRQFAAGAFVGQARHSRLVGISSSRNRFFGLSLVRDRDLRVLGVSATRNGSAGIFFWCVRCLMRNSAANGTKGVGDQTGMLFFQSHHDRILYSSFRGNAGPGILSVKSTNTLIRGNLMAHNGVEGFFMEGGDGFQITHNRSVRNLGGIAFGPGSDNVIKRNHVFHDHEGITVAKGHDNLIAHNVVAHNDHGIRLAINAPVAGAHNIVRRNLVRDSRKDGYLVGKKDRHSRLKDNVAKRSGDDGFDIESRSATLTSNRALDNDDLGIEAVQGTNDGGGNRASGNGDARQCVNVKCH